MNRLSAAVLIALSATLIRPFPVAHAAEGSVVTGPDAVATASSPDFDSVAFVPLSCNSGAESNGDESPGSTDLVGDAAHPAAYYAWDDAYLYVRLRVDGDPTGSKGFNSYSWVILIQSPSGDPFQYQFEISVNGSSSDDDYGNTGALKGDTIEIWENDPAQNVSWSPIFRDSSEIRLWAQRHDFAGPATVNTTPIARTALATDGSAFGGNADYFLDFAVPMSVLIAKGVLASAADMGNCTVYPATSTNASQYNKDHLECPFLPYTTLSVVKSVAPASVPANIPTNVTHTITVRNTGEVIAKGIVIDDTAFPATFAGISVSVSSDDPTVTWTVVTTNPLLMRVPRLARGKSVTVRIQSTATLSCNAPVVTDTASAFATNVLQVTGDAALSANVLAIESCDSKDNNCNGQVDEGVTSCDDGNPCNGSELCIAGGCVPAPPPNCDDDNACTDDSCSPASGCVHVNNTGPCSDGFICTTNDTCAGGNCVGGPPATPNCKEPQPSDYYSHLCAGLHSLDDLTEANLDCVNDWSTFASLDTVEDLCWILTRDTSGDKCLDAEKELLAALLNLCKGRLSIGQPIISNCGSHGTVDQSLIDANTLLSNPNRTAADCAAAQCESEELNSGNATGATMLYADRTPSGVHLRWKEPPTGPGWVKPASYAVWRRPRGGASFGVIATLPDITYDDSDLIPGVDYEYGVTVNWP